MTDFLLTDYNWSVPDTNALIAFSGIVVAAQYQTDLKYAETALQQAADLLFIATGLEDTPASNFEKRLLSNGVCEMAEALFLQQQYKPTLAAPFQSERIGNYSYSKVKASLDAGVPVGLSFFDEAVQYFMDSDIPQMVSTHGMEDDGIWITPGDTETEETSRALLGPADLQPNPFDGAFGTPVGTYGAGGWPGDGVGQGIQP